MPARRLTRRKGANILRPRSSRDNKSIQWKRWREQACARAGVRYRHLFWWRRLFLKPEVAARLEVSRDCRDYCRDPCRTRRITPSLLPWPLPDPGLHGEQESRPGRSSTDNDHPSLDGWDVPRSIEHTFLPSCYMASILQYKKISVLNSLDFDVI